MHCLMDPNISLHWFVLYRYRSTAVEEAPPNNLLNLVSRVLLLLATILYHGSLLPTIVGTIVVLLLDLNLVEYTSSTTILKYLGTALNNLVLNLVHVELSGTAVPGTKFSTCRSTVPLCNSKLCDLGSLTLGKYCTFVCGSLFLIVNS